MWQNLITIAVTVALLAVGWVTPVLAMLDVTIAKENLASAIAQEPNSEPSTEGTEPTNDAETAEETSTPVDVADICQPSEDANETELLSEGGENISAWLSQGEYLLTKKQYPQALIAYYRAIDLDRSNSKAWIGCGQVLQEMEQYDRAIAALNEALKINSNSSIALLTRGLIYKQVEQHESALADFENALAGDGNWGQFDRADAAINLGSVLWRLDQRTEAIAAFEQATELNDRFALAWFNLGTAFLQQASSLLQSQDAEAAKTPLEQAIAAYDRALASEGEWGTNTGPASAWYNRGVALELLEKYEEAMESYDRALRITPNHNKARQRLARLRDL